MKVLIFGATGMVGQGVLRECLLADDVSYVLAVGRSATGQSNPKLHELVHRDFLDYSAVEDQLQGFDACFFCLGVSSLGMSEADYTHLTYVFTLAAATTLARLNPAMTFVYVTGTGTDSSERGRVMWARVKGRTENALQQLPFKAVYLFRPGVIQPLHGVRSKTGWIQRTYTVTSPLLSLARTLLPHTILSTQRIGQAMLAVARDGAGNPVLESRDIEEVARRGERHG
ncbi:NAD(P)H-binding protein [Lysobacter arenosi]|uniref:NAD(P)H-binding protein n=1 Tax=Lysobacter arenosi TaxID=2795387 RepID=A0ABX7REM5_9GAMM|nr:NAD-dependent epimerase/dehydratase family protein [Lysobacter arenosi]QSX75913.1 NAD(P)H-binding protein [Lysobacter arenosi]